MTERSKNTVVVCHIGHVTHDRIVLRQAIRNVLMNYQRDTAVRFNRDQCLVCGAYHNNGNLPCPTMHVTANG